MVQREIAEYRTREWIGLQLLGRIQRRPGRLLAVPEGRVENPDHVAIVVRHLGVNKCVKHIRSFAE